MTETEFPCTHRCGYVSNGQDLAEHEIFEHAPCAECGNYPRARWESVTHKAGCRRLEPGYAYPPAGGNERCPDCGRADCTGEDCYWPGEAGLR